MSFKELEEALFNGSITDPNERAAAKHTLLGNRYSSFGAMVNDEYFEKLHGTKPGEVKQVTTVTGIGRSLLNVTMPKGTETIGNCVSCDREVPIGAKVVFEKTRRYLCLPCFHDLRDK